MKNLTFTELKTLYPTLSARSKDGLLKQIKDLTALEVVAEELEVPTENVVAIVNAFSDYEATTALLEEEGIVSVVSDAKSTEFDLKEDTYTWYNILNYIHSISTGKEKVLIECPTTMEADLIWARCKDELFPKLHKENISLMASSTRRDMHLNGTCYVRFVCHTNFAHLKTIFRYTTFKKLV